MPCVCQRTGRESVSVMDNTLSVVSELSAPSVHRFDAVLTPDVTQAQTFDYVRPLLQSALEGYNATIFAYGQTVRSCVCLVAACILNSCVGVVRERDTKQTWLSRGVTHTFHSIASWLHNIAQRAMVYGRSTTARDTQEKRTS